jgi:transposase-like protein
VRPQGSQPIVAQDHRPSTSAHAAIEAYIAENEASIELLEVKYLTNIVEQEHHVIKRMTRSMLQVLLVSCPTLPRGELMHMTRPTAIRAGVVSPPAERPYSLAA